MPSLFHDLMQAASAACDEAFGERTRLVAQGRDGYVVGADATRPTFEAIGVVIVEAAPSSVRGDRRSDADTAQVHTEHASVAYVRSALAWMPQTGDRVDLIERPGSPSYRVSRVDADNVGRAVVILAPRAS